MQNSQISHICLLVFVSMIAANSSLAQYNRRTPIVEAVDKVLPSVVNISTEKEVTELVRVSPFGPRFNSPFDRLFERNYQVEGLGSGVLVGNGYVITNNHVVDSEYGQPDKIYVTFYKDSHRYEADIIGLDPQADIAVLKINEAIDRHGLPWGHSDDLMIGETVIAVGNALGQPFTVTNGIISALNRVIDVDSDTSLTNLIQTNADINRGNSGGPLVNINGEFIGLNTAIISPSGGSIGLGFAIPVDRVRNTFDYWVHDLISLQDQLGINIQEMTPPLIRYYKNYYPNLENVSLTGVVVTEIYEQGLAEQHLLKRDIITSVNDQVIESSEDFFNSLNDHQGSVLSLELIREGNNQTIRVQVPSKKVETLTWAGMEVQALDTPWRRRLKLPEKYTGLVVRQVEPNSSAAKEGLQRGDWIDAINNEPVSDLDDLRRYYRDVNRRSINIDFLRYEKSPSSRTWQDNWKRQNIQLELAPTL